MDKQSKPSRLTALRNALVAALGNNEHALVGTCATAGLAFLFGGIWLGDGQFYIALDNEAATLVMRVYSLALYAVFLLLAMRLTRRGPFDLQSFFMKTMSFGLVCFAIGYVGLAWIAGNPSLPGNNAQFALWAFFFLTKVIGAPLTIGLVCVFSQLDRKATMRLAIVGILGAFVIYSASSQLVVDASGISTLKLAVSAAFIVASSVLGMLGLNNEMFGRITYTEGEMLDRHVIKRPIKEVLGGGMVLTVVFSAIALGYLRSGFIGSDAHLQPASIIVLLVVVIISLLRQNLRIEHLFTFALFCTACSILLRPFLDAVSPIIVTLLANTGTALFEVIVWRWAVWVARNAQETLMAASIVRLATVTGHLLGTIAVALALLVTDNTQDASGAAGMLIILIYLVQVSVIVKSPSLSMPILMVEDAGDSNAASAKAAGAIAAMQQGKAAAASHTGAADDGTASAPDSDSPKQDTASSADYEELYWSAPVTTVAQTYQLTRREQEVLGLLARGHSFSAMEEKLCISHNTMKMHARNIYTKMEVHSRQDVISMVDLIRAKQLGNSNLDAAPR